MRSGGVIQSFEIGRESSLFMPSVVPWMRRSVSERAFGRDTGSHSTCRRGNRPATRGVSSRRSVCALLESRLTRVSGVASGLSEMTGDRLAHSPAAEDQSPPWRNRARPCLVHRARPTAGVGTPSMNLSIHNLDRIDRFSLKGCRVVNLGQSKHLYFVG